MEFFAFAVVSFALLVISTSAELPGHGLRVKSLQQAEYECRQYLQPEGCSNPKECLDRCQLLVLRSWNDTSGLVPLPFSRHFQPDADDQDYANRTRKCITDGTASVSAEDVCRRASTNWNCYRDQYGAAVGTPQLVPAPALLLMNAINHCASILQIEQAELAVYIRSRYEFSAKSRCMYRCVKIRLGLWNDVTGPNLGRLYVQCGGYGLNEKNFYENAQRCTDELRSKCYDNCTLATRIGNDCFPRKVTLVIYTCDIIYPITKPILDALGFESGCEKNSGYIKIGDTVINISLDTPLTPN